MQPLRADWVNSIFARLQVRYGSAWTRMWEGVSTAAVVADWAEELGGFAGRPEAIKHALENLPPDRPPTVAQFRLLCIGAPQPMPPQLPAPKTDDAVVAAVVRGLQRGQMAGPKAWAHRMREREERGDLGMTAAQRVMWRAALEPKETA